jgi:hypothetical protein
VRARRPRAENRNRRFMPRSIPRRLAIQAAESPSRSRIRAPTQTNAVPKARERPALTASRSIGGSRSVMLAVCKSHCGAMGRKRDERNGDPGGIPIRHSLRRVAVMRNRVIIPSKIRCQFSKMPIVSPQATISQAVASHFSSLALMPRSILARRVRRGVHCASAATQGSPLSS